MSKQYSNWGRQAITAPYPQGGRNYKQDITDKERKLIDEYLARRNTSVQTRADSGGNQEDSNREEVLSSRNSA
jgi:hypothetical protein